jgi:phytoene dehydrogenase-like protein
MAEKFDAIVAGGGLSGMGVGALLAAAGKKVIVLEKSPYLGGRATSFKYRGFLLNVGQHAVLQGGKVERLMEAVGRPLDDEKDKGFFEELSFYEDGKYKTVMEKVLVDKPEEARKFYATLAEIEPKDMPKFDGITAAEWLAKYVTDPKLRWLAHTNATTCCTTRKLEDMAASALIESMKVISRSPITYMLTKGIGSLSQTMAEVIKGKGGDVRPRAKVLHVIVENKKVRGVSVEIGDETPDGMMENIIKIEAPLVITAFPVWDLFKVLEEKLFPPDFVKMCLHLDNRVSNIGFSVATKEPLIAEKKFIFADVPQKNDVPLALTILPTSVVVPPISLEGNHLTEFTCVCEPSFGTDPERIAKTIAEIKEFVNQIFPGWEKKALWIRPFYHWEEPSRTAGRMGKFRPGPKAPGVEGLFFAGDTVNSRTVPGLEAATDSALICAEAILGKLP